MTKQSVNLLQTIYASVGCPYLSDLHSGQYDSEIKRVVQTLSPYDYPFDEWQRTIRYIFFQESPCSDEKAAHELLSSDWVR